MKIMKKIVLTLILFNIYSICTASAIVARQGVNALTKTAYNNSTRSITNGAMKPATRNKAVQAQEQAQQAANAQSKIEREAQINQMNKEFSSQPSYSYNNTPITQADKLQNIMRTRQSAVEIPKASPSEADKFIKAVSARQNQVIEAAKNNAASKPVASTASSEFSAFDKAYLGGGFAAVAAMFGYDALKNEENNLATDTNLSAVTLVNEATHVEADTNLAGGPVGAQDSTAEKIISPGAPLPVEAVALPVETANNSAESEQVTTYADFAKKHAYEDPKNALADFYNNPNGTTALNAAVNPAIAGIALGTAAAGGYAYYQYLQYLERVAQAKKDKAAQQALSENDNESSDLTSTGNQPGA